MRVVFFAAISATAVLIGACASQTAYAFCRTTTSQVPLGYNPAASGCWTQGTPLAWPTSAVPYGLGAAASRQVSLADATRVADLAFSSWNDVSCPDGVPTAYAYDVGPLSSVPDGGTCSSNLADCKPLSDDVIVFDDDVWPYDDPANTLALTTVTYGVDDGAIFEAYTEINTTPPHLITMQEPPPAGSSAYDLQAILTHEAGHFLGLAHATDATSVMYAYYLPGRVQLTSDDVAGFCAVYPPLSDPFSSNVPRDPLPDGCATASSASPRAGATGLGLLLVPMTLAAARLRRRRARRELERLRLRPASTP